MYSTKCLKKQYRKLKCVIRRENKTQIKGTGRKIHRTSWKAFHHSLASQQVIRRILGWRARPLMEGSLFRMRRILHSKKTVCSLNWPKGWDSFHLCELMFQCHAKLLKLTITCSDMPKIHGINDDHVVVVLEVRVDWLAHIVHRLVLALTLVEVWGSLHNGMGW